ncbi:MAG: sigma-70 family RNA polymerase sigma factor [Peptostreptococcaceae bacterium]|nr:sigma-70 family RNA polymerase sigma factor [Peptostreptococcaceae bacterium]
MDKSIQYMVVDTAEGRSDFRGVVVRRLEPLIKKSIGRFYYGDMDYEDLMQEGRLRLLKEIDRFDPERGTVFLGVAQKSLRYLYCELRRKKVPLCLLNVCIRGDGDNREEIDLIEDLVDIGDLCIGKEIRLTMKGAFDRLRPVHKDMIREYFLKGKTLRQIAGERGIHYMTAVQRKRRALEELGKNLEDMGYEV